MLTFTKSTISNWTEWVASIEYNTARDDAILAMVSAGKTDGNREFGTGLLIRRNWVDQAAAEEWKNWIITHVPPEHLISMDIVDYVPE